MPLIDCPDCGKQISPYAESCPNCGCPSWRFSVSTDSPLEPSLKKGGRHLLGRWGFQVIKWRILDVSGGSALLVTEEVIDCMPYDDRGVGVTWERCSLRRWLNKSFLRWAFSDAERASIEMVRLPNPDNAHYGTRGGSDTWDSVFCLSIDEAQKYFQNDEDRMACASAKAISEGVWAHDDGIHALWWLRSPGVKPVAAAIVGTSGNVFEFGNRVNLGDIGVRPAIWIEL